MKPNQKCPQYYYFPTPGPQGPRGPVGPQGPQGIPGPASTGTFSGMYATAAYPIAITAANTPTAVPFDTQSLTQGSFTFIPGSTAAPLTAGTLVVNQPGVYEIYDVFSNLTSSAAATLQTNITVNGIALPRSASTFTAAAGQTVQMSHQTVAALNTGDRLQVTVQASAATTLTAAANSAELRVTRVGRAPA